MKKYAELVRDTSYFLKGTQFEVTNEDDGFWSRNPFYGGIINTMHLSFEPNAIKIIKQIDYKGIVLPKPKTSCEPSDPWDYLNYPG